MGTTIEQQVALDKVLVPSAQRVPGQSFAELPFEEEILEFFRFLGHSAQIKTLTDVNVNKLYQPWRSFAAVINKCMTGKSSGFDSLRLSQADWIKTLLFLFPYFFFLTLPITFSFFCITLTTLCILRFINFGEEDQGLRISEEERMHEEEEAAELYRDVDINQGRGLQVSKDINNSHVTLTLVHSDGQQESSSTSSFVTSLLNPIINPGMESIFTTGSSFVTPIPSPKSTMTPSIMTTTTTASQPPTPPTPIPSDILQTLPTFASIFCFEDSVKSLEVNFSEFMRTNQSPKVVSNILGRLQDSIQRENDEFLRTIDDNMKKIIKEQVKSQVKAQVTRILPRIEEYVNAQLEALVEAYDADKTILDSYGESAILKRRREEDDDQEGPSAGSDRGSKRRREGGEHASASTPSEPATMSACSDAPIPPTILPSEVFQNLPTFDSVFRFEDRVKSLEVNFSEFMQTNQFAEAVSNISGRTLRWIRLGSKRQREGGEPELASTPSEPATKSASRSTTGTQYRQMSASESAFAEEHVQTTCQMDELPHLVFETGAEDQPIVQTSQHPEWFSQPRKPPTPDRDWNKTLPAVQGRAQTWISELVKQADSRSSFNELLDTPIDFSNFIMNRLCVDTLTLELLARPTYELMRGSCTSLTELKYHMEEPLPLIPDNRGRRVIPFAHFINNDLEYLREGASSRKYITSVTNSKAADYGHIKWIEDLVPHTMWIQEPLNYDKHTLWGVSHWGGNVGSSTDWISVRRDDDKIYKFKEGDFKRLRLQDIEDMLLLLVQGKLSNLTVEERFAFNVSLRMFTRSIVIQWMQYLPQTIWRKGDKDKAAVMIQAIDKMLKTRRIMRSLERFIGGRLYEETFECYKGPYDSS
nr:hypothetical protein [Tanacetum cinerariifolium]